MERRTALIIVNYRTAGLTLACLESLARERGGRAEWWRVVVVDNASPDGSGGEIARGVLERGWGAWVEVVLHPVNAGFGAGNNVAIRRLLREPDPPEYLFLLNPDTIVYPGAIDELAWFLGTHPRAGVAGALLLHPDGRAQGSAHFGFGLARNLIDGAWTGVLDRLLHRAGGTLPAPGGPRRCDWVSGAAMMVRRGVFERVGLFDEGFFLYFDEVDLQRRAAGAGYEAWYVPSARIVHLEGQSTGIREPGRRPGYWFDSRRRLLVKHYGVPGLVAADMLWLAGRAIREVRALLTPGRRAELRGGPRELTRDMIFGDAGWLLGRSDARPARPDPPRKDVAPPRTGTVVIGRNEGPRLEAALRSARAAGGPVVYVDSRSGDGSAARAASLGVRTLGIPDDQPLSAARARNIGWRALLDADPTLELFQFVDGDCELSAGWFQSAWNELAARPDAAIVFGRVREKHPDANIYTRMCEMEFDRPPGDVGACGGIFMVRASAMKQVGGFNPEVVAAEEPELSKRITDGGWKIVRLGRDMCIHDSGMTRLSQWWRREMRGGYAGIDAARRFGLPQYRRQNRSARVWTLGVIGLAMATGGAAGWAWGWVAGLAAAAAVLGLIVLQAARLAARAAMAGLPMRAAAAYGGMMMLSKWAQVYGQGKRALELARGRAARVVEHRGIEAATPTGGAR